MVTITSTKAECVLDPSVVNGDTLPLMKDVGLSIFADACSKNRGAFVVQPPDGKTYGCLSFPENLLDRVGISGGDSGSSSGSPQFQVKDVEGLKDNLRDGNITAGEAVKLLNFLVTNVYQSTPDAQASPYACDVNGLVTLNCGETEQAPPIRAVTLAGLFTPALWATEGRELTLDQASTFYTSQDFSDMKKLGLNTVQIPVHVKVFSHTDPGVVDWKNLLLHVLHQARIAGLRTILLLEQGASHSADMINLVQNAAAFAQDYNSKRSDSVIVALTLPALDNTLLRAANETSPDLPLWIPVKGGDFQILNQYPLAKGASLELSHTAAVADVASSSSVEDRGKMFYHEATACINRAPLDYSRCYQNISVMVASGFDLAIDDCHTKGFSDTFHDYGQCDRFNETISSPWWKAHRYSFAARQLFAYEQGKGWSFATWKLYGTDPDNLGVLDQPAKLLALQEVVAAGIMPSLHGLDKPTRYPLDSGESPVGLACLNTPENDFVMGDATFAPTPSPPPDCGPGWWNFTTDKCDYWIPPSPAPTPGCPVCPNDTLVDPETVECPPAATYDVDTMVPSYESNNIVVYKSFFAGAIAAFVISFIVAKLMGSKLCKRNDYEPVPAGNGQSYQGA